MRMNHAFAAALVLCLLAAAPAGAHYRYGGERCRPVAFTPQSDDAASDIRARGVSCRTARRVVRAHRSGDTTPLGYACRTRTHDPMGLSHTDITCTKDRARVTWAQF